jgi:hypothetical protein
MRFGFRFAEPKGVWMSSARLLMVHVFTTIAPMGRPNIDGPLSFGANPRLSATATRKR